jgi:glycine C-acetyltransferase
VQSDSERRRRLFENAAKLKCGLRALGFAVPDFPSPITALFLQYEDLSTVKEYVMGLRERGVFVTAVIHPVVPKGVVCIRMIPTASHTEEQIALTLEACREVQERVRLDGVAAA